MVPSACTMRPAGWPSSTRSTGSRRRRPGSRGRSSASEVQVVEQKAGQRPAERRAATAAQVIRRQPAPQPGRDSDVEQTQIVQPRIHRSGECRQHLRGCPPSVQPRNCRCSRRHVGRRHELGHELGDYLVEVRGRIVHARQSVVLSRQDRHWHEVARRHQDHRRLRPRNGTRQHDGQPGRSSPTVLKLVIRVRDEEVAGSNPVTPTTQRPWSKTHTESTDQGLRRARTGTAPSADDRSQVLNSPVDNGLSSIIWLSHPQVASEGKTEVDEPLSKVFPALAAPTRRDIVARLATEDATVGELAAPYDVTTQAVSKHLKVLQEAGLVTRSRDAQRRPVHLEAEVFDLMTKWIERYRREAEQRYRRLDAVLAAMQDDETPVARPEEGTAS